MGDRNSHFWLDANDTQLWERFSGGSKPFISSEYTMPPSKIRDAKRLSKHMLSQRKSWRVKIYAAIKTYRPSVKWTNRNKVILCCGAAVLAILVGASLAIYQRPNNQAKSTIKTSEFGYNPVLPSKKSVNDLTKSELAASYDTKSKVLSYDDTFAGSGFTLTQQPVPDGFSSKDEAIASALDGFGAGSQIKTSKGVVYIATDRVTGYQIALLPIQKRLLLYIKSQNIVDEYTWKLYIESLKV